MDDLEREESEADSTLGPGFDLIVGLLAVVLVALQLSRASLAGALGGETDLNYVLASKNLFVETLCRSLSASHADCAADPHVRKLQGAVALGVALNDGRTVDISVADIGTNQTLRIGNELLFESGKATLQPAGVDALNRVIGVVRQCQGLLREVQIQGHADSQQFYGKGGNLQLASDRAISVYNQFLHDGLDPHALVFSAATYDAYKPVDRDPGQDYDWNSPEHLSEAAKQANRRVELHLIYRLAAPVAGAQPSCALPT